LLKFLFSYSLPLCKQLQKIEIDLREAIELADDNVKALKHLRENIDIAFHKMFENAKVTILYNLILILFIFLSISQYIFWFYILLEYGRYFGYNHYC
jgi:hypothetical protein